jgi:hypothetical protein
MNECPNLNEVKLRVVFPKKSSLLPKRETVGLLSSRKCLQRNEVPKPVPAAEAKRS